MELSVTYHRNGETCMCNHLSVSISTFTYVMHVHIKYENPHNISEA